MTPISPRGTSELLAENQRLKARIKALEEKRSPISIDPATGEIEVDRLNIGGLEVEKLRMHSPALREKTDNLSKPGNLLPTLKNPASLGELANKPVVVDELKARIPLPVATTLMESVAGQQMREAGLSEVALRQGEGESLNLTGKVKKGFKLPFEVNGTLAAGPDGKIRFALRKSRLAGIPVPGFLLSIATRMAGQSLQDAGVEVNGSNFQIDPKAFKPKNVFLGIDHLSVHDGAILLEGGAHVHEGTSPVPKTSTP